MKIGELARRAGLNASAIRYYEKLSLLAPPQRTGGQRRYPSDALHRVLLIRFASDMASTSAIDHRTGDNQVFRVRVASPLFLGTASPRITSGEGRVVRNLRRIGKRIAIGVEGDLWLVLHLMIAGRLHWRPPQAKLAGR